MLCCAKVNKSFDLKSNAIMIRMIEDVRFALRMHIAIPIQSNGVTNACKYDRGSLQIYVLHVNHFQLNGIYVELALGKR